MQPIVALENFLSSASNSASHCTSFNWSCSSWNVDSAFPIVILSLFINQYMISTCKVQVENPYKYVCPMSCEAIHSLFFPNEVTMSLSVGPTQSGVKSHLDSQGMTGPCSLYKLRGHHVVVCRFYQASFFDWAAFVHTWTIKNDKLVKKRTFQPKDKGSSEPGSFRGN